jgi:hypothetical protein
LKTTGARDIDIPEINAAYNQVKEYYSQSGKIKDSERPLFKATIKNMMNTVNETSLRSKELEGRLYSTASTVAQNPWDYDPKVIQDLDYIRKTPISKLGAMANMGPLDYQRLPNFETINNIYKDTNAIGQKNSKFIEELREGGKRRNLSRVDENVIKTDLIQRFTNSPEATKAISYRYSKKFGKQPTNEDLTNYIMDEYKAKYGFDYVGEPLDLKSDGISKSESKQNKLKEERRKNVINLVDKGSQEVFELIKSTLPTGSRMNAINLGEKGTVAVDIYVPSSRNKFGELQGEINQRIDFTKGNPYAAVNNILNKYSGKDFSSEELFTEEEVPGYRKRNVSKNTTSAPKKELTWVERQAAKNKK